MAISEKHKASFGCSSWCSVQIECEPGFEDILSSCIFESGFSGLEESNKSSKTILTAFFPETTVENSPLKTFERRLDEMTKRLGKLTGRILSVDNVPFEDWELSWREGLDAIEIGSKLIVRPSWVDYQNSEARVEIIIDPKMAFGTGSHATTYLCLETFDEYDFDGLSVLDAGCGSGILSIAAAKFGARSVYGFDYDEFSVENAIENITNNAVDDIITIEKAELKDVKTEPCDFVFANMISGVLVPNLAVLRSFVSRDGMIVFSGLLAEEEAMFTGAIKQAGFKAIKITQRDEWIAVYANLNVD